MSFNVSLDSQKELFNYTSQFKDNKTLIKGILSHPEYLEAFVDKTFNAQNKEENTDRSLLAKEFIQEISIMNDRETAKKASSIALKYFNLNRPVEELSTDNLVEIIQLLAVDPDKKNEKEKYLSVLSDHYEINLEFRNKKFFLSIEDLEQMKASEKFLNKVKTNIPLSIHVELEGIEEENEEESYSSEEESYHSENETINRLEEEEIQEEGSEEKSYNSEDEIYSSGNENSDHLEEEGATGYNITDIEKFLDFITKWGGFVHSLKVIEIENAHLFDDAALLKISNNCPNLDELCIEQVPITDATCLNVLQVLQKLELADCNNLKKIPDISTLKNLKEVDLSGNSHLTKISVEMLPHLKRLQLVSCPNLEELSLGDRDFIDLNIGNSERLSQKSIDDVINLYLHMFDATITDKKQQKDLISSCYQNMDVLNIIDDHPLITRIVQAQSILGEEKNAPHTIYNKLKEEVSKEPYIDASTFENASALKIDTLRESCQTRVFTGRDLPDNVNESTLTELTQRFESRLAGLTPEKRKEIEDKIIGDNYIKMRSNFTESSFIRSLCVLKPDKDEPISQDQFFLMSILGVIEKMSQKIDEKQLLSQQEEMLFNLFHSVQNCPTGKRAGLMDMYYTLVKGGLLNAHVTQSVKESNPSNSASDSDFNESIKKDGRRWILECIYPEMEAILMDEAFVQKLINSTSPISEMSHQTKYLKNRFHRQIGLPSHVEFDPGTHLVVKKLLKLDSKEFLENFFNELSLDKIIENIKNASKNFGPNWKNVEALLLRKDPKFNKSEEYFEFDEDGTPVKFTKKGVILLLEAANLIDDVPKDEKEVESKKRKRTDQKVGVESPEKYSKTE